MTSLYLTEEYTELTRQRLLRRIADEALVGADGQPCWTEDSGYHLLPEAERLEVLAILYDENPK